MSRTVLASNTLAVATSFRQLFTIPTARKIAASTHSAAAVRQVKPRFFSTTRPNQFINSTSKMGVHNIQGKHEYEQQVVTGSNENLVVLDCFATWCGPCKAIAPTIAKYSEEYSHVKFYKVDVDESPDVAQELGVRAMPTFVFFKGGERVGELVGANPGAIKNMIEQHQ